LIKYYLGDESKENENGGTCSTNGRDKNFIQNLVEKPERKRPLGDPDVDGR
jgi:hypothetical protein